MNDSPAERRAVKFSDVRKQLEDYRRLQAEKKEEADRLAVEKEKKRVELEEKAKNPPRPLQFLEIFAVDFLDIYPLRMWRQFHERYPLQCWTITGAVWLIGQLLAVHVEFGLVFFVLSLFFVMFVHLGNRAEGELSAYSVFNQNCERLMGQMTSEHFERDMLMQPREDD